MIAVKELRVTEQEFSFEDLSKAIGVIDLDSISKVFFIAVEKFAEDKQLYFQLPDSMKKKVDYEQSQSAIANLVNLTKRLRLDSGESDW